MNGIMITRCACGKCENMPTARKSVCCQEIPEGVQISLPGQMGAADSCFANVPTVWQEQ